MDCRVVADMAFVLSISTMNQHMGVKGILVTCGVITLLTAKGLFATMSGLQMVGQNMLPLSCVITLGAMVFWGMFFKVRSEQTLLGCTEGAS